MVDKKGKRNKSSTSNDDLFANLDKAKKANVKGIARKKASKIKENDEIINLEIKEDDWYFVQKMKQLINSQKISLKRIYEFYGQKKGYNMFYSLKEKGELGIPRFMQWCIVLGVFPKITFVKFNWSKRPDLIELYNRDKKETKKKSK